MKANILILFIILSNSLYAQTIGVTGIIFEKKTKTVAKPIPFATVYYYDNKDRESLEYVRYADLWGNYDLDKNVPVKEYYVVIKAPGFETNSKPIGNLPSSEEVPSHYDGGVTLHYELQPTPQEQAFAVTTYTPKELIKKTKKIVDYIYAVPTVTKDESGNILTKDGKTVRIFIHGRVPQVKSIEEFNEIKSSMVHSIEYYDLNDSYQEYGSAINIILKVKKNGALMESFNNNFMPIELKKYEIE